MSTQPAMFFVKCNGRRPFWVERDADETGKAALMHDLIGRQITDVMQILCIEDGLATDVTEEIAMAIADWSSSKCEPLHPKLIDWIHDYAGSQVARELKAA